MKTFWCVYYVFCTTLIPDFVNSKVELVLPTKTVLVSEKANRKLHLIDAIDAIKCRDTTDGDKTRAWLSSITPTTPCFGCFTVDPCDDNKPWIYCLIYQPNDGELSYSVVKSYTAVVTCTDDIETPSLSATVEIRVTSNLPPLFDPPALFESVIVRLTSSLREGDIVYSVLTKDNEKDPVFFNMYTEPVSKLFTIGYGSGVIRAVTDLRFLCATTMTFYVSIWDPYHNPGPQKVFQASFKGANDKPSFISTPHTLEVKEDASVGSAVDAISVSDPTKYPDIDFYMSSLNHGALDLYYVSRGRLRVRRPLDFEYQSLREVSITLRAFDGFCFSDDYVLRVVITDVNEDFILQPTFLEPVVLEGFVNYEPNLTIVDQDVNDVHTYSRVTGLPKLNVQSASGFITSELIDSDPREKKSLPITVQVRDSSTSPIHAHSFEINFTMIDINDNAPVFIKNSYEFKVDNCTQLGVLVGKVNAKDDDSPLNGNNLLRYGGGGATFFVLSDGNVQYTSLLAVGKTDIGSASVTDMGLYPKPLAGDPAKISLVCEVCAEPPTTVRVTTTTTTTTTTPWTGPRSATAAEVLRADRASNKMSWQAHNLGWIAAAACVLALLIILVSFMLWRHITCPRPKPRPRKVKGSEKQEAKSGPKNEKTQQQQQQQQSDLEQRSWPQQTQQLIAPLGQQPPPPAAAAAAVQQGASNPSPLQQQPLQQQPLQQLPQQPQPRSEILATSDGEVDVPMQPPSLAYPLVFQEKPPQKVEPSKSTKPTKTTNPLRNDKPSKDTKPPKKPAKDAKESQNPKPAKNTKPTENFKPTIDKKTDKKKAEESSKPSKEKADEAPKSTNEEIYHKPQMQVGEYIDLEIITPRNSPLPRDDRW